MEDCLGALIVIGLRIAPVDRPPPVYDNGLLLQEWRAVVDLVLPETRYALSGDVNIAYQVVGEGPLDIIIVPGIVSHVEFQHETPGYTSFLRRLSSFARVVTFDKRGQGLSDRISGAPSLEQRMDDVRAIMDTIGSDRAVVMGFSEGCAMSALFAATFPERASQLLLFGGFPTSVDLSADWEERIAQRVKFWGTGAMIRTVAPSQAGDPDAVASFAKFERLSASPGAIKAISLLNAQACPPERAERSLVRFSPSRGTPNELG